MNANETILDAVNKLGVGVRIGFRRIGDRFSHTLYGVRGGEALAIVESVDDADTQGWPLSLPVQELREATDAARNRSLLLMGAAVYGHWSASVAAARDGDRDPYLAIDVAVRLHRAPHYLGVAYEAVPDADWIDMPGGLAFPKRDDHALCITASFDAAGLEEGQNPLELLKAFRDPEQTNRRLFLPMAALPAQYPATYRWRYSIASAVQ